MKISKIKASVPQEVLLDEKNKFIQNLCNWQSKGT